jgi:two-component system, OmpR family, KDP operon response regulator KdpE
MAETTRVLLVEDDRNTVDLIRSNLTVRGYDLIVSGDGAKALQLLEVERPELILLEPTLRTVNGFELCREIRERSSVGLIVLSSRRAEDDKVRALNLGADDYITKPFDVEELLARMMATLRRTRPSPPSDTVPSTIHLGDVTIDLEAQSVTRCGAAVRLTPTEFGLLREFALNQGRLLSHQSLLRRVWGIGYDTQREYIRVYVRRLRSKLEVPGSSPLIITEPRAGYRLVAA